MSEALTAEEKETAATGADVDTGHEYDGIREFDNKLPNWWLATLWGAVFFSIGYWAYYHTFAVGDSTLESFHAEMERAESVAAAKEAAGGGTSSVTDEELLALAKDPGVVTNGKAVYDQNCLACHAATGGGGIGPNLTDAFWIHGHAPAANYKVVSDGMVAKGMPAWKQVLGESKAKAVTAYILTLRDTNVAGGKAAQGEDKDGKKATP